MTIHEEVKHCAKCLSKVSGAELQRELADRIERALWGVAWTAYIEAMENGLDTGRCPSAQVVPKWVEAGIAGLKTNTGWVGSLINVPK